MEKKYSFTGEIPFSIALPKAPDSINGDFMTASEIHVKLQRGYEDMENGRVQDAAEAFDRFREKYQA